MKIRPLVLVAALASFTVAAFAQSSSNLVARFNTTQGNIDVQLFPATSPQTVANFLRYVNRGLYKNMVIHRSVSGFVFQGGYVDLQDNSLNPISTYPDVPGEPGVSNTRGTIAMALSSGPDTGNSQWFFNEVDNSSALDGTSDGGPFTVFGQVANANSLAVMDLISAVPVPNPSPFSGALDQIPLVDYVAPTVTVSNLVIVNYITLLNPPLYFQNGTLLGNLTLSTSFAPNAWQGVGAMNSGWQERAVADINGDGVPDIIFQNGTLLGVLLMNADGTPNSWVGIGAMNAGWELRGAADINNDGQPELIFQNGTLLGYLTVNTSAQPVAWAGIGAMGTGWELRAVADLNGDGQPDLIFQNGTSLGVLQVGTNGLPTTWTGMGAMTAGWTLGEAADANADGQPDLIFQNGTSLGALQVNTSFQPVTWTGIGGMGAGWVLPGDY